jgi:hypothetical protein
MDLPIPSGQVSSQVILVVCALLDFIYLAQFPSHSPNTLMHLEDLLCRFHDNKDIFIDLGIRDHFNIPKIHSLHHYVQSIRLYRTTDNYNTEQTEQLHIDFTKDAYRATNHKDEYSQMTAWLERCEKIQMHSNFIKWQRQSEQERIPSAKRIGPPHPGAQILKMTQHPMLKAVSFDILAQQYGAVDFQDTLANYIAHINNPTTSGAALASLAANTLIPFRSVPVYHRIKFVNSLDTSEIVDAVQVRPEQKDARGRAIPSRFDTVLIRGKSDGVVRGSTGEFCFCRDIVQADCYAGHRIVQVRVVFQIPSKVVHEVFPSSDITPPEHLAYVEWFSPLPVNPGSNHLLYRVTRLAHRGRRRSSIIPVDSIIRSVHLFPVFGQHTPQEWNTFSVLELCNAFYLQLMSYL